MLKRACDPFDLSRGFAPSVISVKVVRKDVRKKGNKGIGYLDVTSSGTYTHNNDRLYFQRRLQSVIPTVYSKSPLDISSDKPDANEASHEVITFASARSDLSFDLRPDRARPLVEVSTSISRSCSLCSATHCSHDGSRL